MVPRLAYHHGDLASALIAAAVEQVRARGAEAVSLRSVATAVGVSPSAAYHHFADKDALLAAAGSQAMNELESAMRAAVAGIKGRSRRAAVNRVRAVGQAYIGFALKETHLFRLAFGPLCAQAKPEGEQGNPEDGEAYSILSACLDDLDRLKMLRPGTREGLDFVMWTAVHGVASLIIEGLVPPDAGELLLDTMGRAIFVEPSR